MSLTKVTKSFSQEKISHAIYIEVYHSDLRKVQDNLIPYFYDQNGSAGFTLGYSVKFKKLLFFSPQIDFGLNTSGYSLKHFDKIYDTIQNIYLEDWFTYRTIALKVGVTANISITKAAAIYIGANFYIPVSEREKKSVMLIDGISSSQSSKLSSTKNSVKYNKTPLINLRTGLAIKLSKHFIPSCFFEYGVSYLRNPNSPDFLSSQLNLGFCVVYQFRGN